MTAVIDTVLADLAADGVAVLPGVLAPGACADALARLWAASRRAEEQGIPTHIPQLDPNPANVRVFNLIGLDGYFAELIAHPLADEIVSGLLGPDYIISNFTANIARPGSGSMFAHSDLALVMPEPWTSAQSVNVMWCLTDACAANGATRYLPGSHRFETMTDVPDDVVAAMVPLEAPAGSVVVMEGRVWHTSGCNVTADEDRALLFGYYTKPHIRPQVNMAVLVPDEIQATFDPLLRARLGLDGQLVRPDPAAHTST